MAYDHVCWRSLQERLHLHWLLFLSLPCLQAQFQLTGEMHTSHLSTRKENSTTLPTTSRYLSPVLCASSWSTILCCFQCSNAPFWRKQHPHRQPDNLCACIRIGQWCASVVAIRSLSLFTNQADRCSQISSFDSCCATRVSKTLDVVHRYALLVSNSDML